MDFNVDKFRKVGKAGSKIITNFEKCKVSQEIMGNFANKNQDTISYLSFMIT